MLLKRTSISCALLLSGLCLVLAADPPPPVNSDIYQAMWDYFRRNPSSTETIQQVYNQIISEVSAGHLASNTPMALPANMASTLAGTATTPIAASAALVAKAEPATMPLAPIIEPNIAPSPASPAMNPIIAPAMPPSPPMNPMVVSAMPPSPPINPMAAPAIVPSPPSHSMNPAMTVPSAAAQTPRVVAAPLIPVTTVVYSSVESTVSPISPAPPTGTTTMHTATSSSMTTAHPSVSSISRSISLTRSGMPSSTTTIPPIPSQANRVSLNIGLALSVLLILLCHL